MTEQTTIATCTENDGGLCDLKGILIEDDDTCERWSYEREQAGRKKGKYAAYISQQDIKEGD